MAKVTEETPHEKWQMKRDAPNSYEGIHQCLTLVVG